MDKEAIKQMDKAFMNHLGHLNDTINKECSELLKSHPSVPDMMNDQLLADKLHRLAGLYYDDTSQLLEIAASRLYIPNRRDETFLKLGEIVAKHNFEKDRHVEICLIEEMSELTKEVCKSQRNKGDIDHTIEELGHVILMCYSLMSKHKFDHGKVLHEAEKAVQKMYDQNNERITFNKRMGD